MKKTLAERFWPKVAHRGANECWPWTGALRLSVGVKGLEDARGVIGVNGKQLLAHRVAYALYYDVVPGPKTVVCHTCDNPRCVNPHHLMLSSQKANQVDAGKKGRKHGYGRHYSDELVREAHRLARGGMTQAAIAKTLGVSCAQVTGQWLRGWCRRDIYEEFNGVRAVAA